MKPLSVRGLNFNHNRDLKNIFKAAATTASAKPGPFRDFRKDILKKGIAPEIARLTLAQDSRRYSDGLEERRTLQSGATETTSSLSALGE